MDNSNNLDNLYLCIKTTDNNYIPFFIVNGSFFSKIQENNDNFKGGNSSSLSIDEILQHVNYKEILDNDKLKEAQMPALEANESNGGAIDNQKMEFEMSKNNIEESALPEDFKNYLRHKLNKY